MEGKDDWDMKDTERMEEVISTRYYCFRCHPVVTVDVEIICPFCPRGYIQACEDVPSLYLAMSSESECSESGSHGENTRGLYDSNHGGSVILDIGSQDVTNDVAEPQHEIRATSFQWILLPTDLVLEILSAGFDQVSSPCKPHFALIGMLLAIAAIFACIFELLYIGLKNRVVLRKRGMLWCFYYPPPKNMLFGTFPEIFGLGLAIVQCILSGVQYYFLKRHATNPIKLSPLPVIFLLSVVVCRMRNQGFHF